MGFDKYRFSVAFFTAFVFTFIALQFYTYPSVWHKSGLQKAASSPSERVEDIRSFLKPYVGDSEFRYARRHVHIRHGASPDNWSLPALDAAFDPRFVANIDLKSRRDAEAIANLPAQGPLELEIPAPQYRDHTAKLMFGLATDVSRLEDNLDHMKLWMRSKGVHILTIVPPDSGAKKLQEAWRDLGIDITIVERDASFFDRLLSLVPEMLKLAEYQHKGDIEWYTILDDDTFIPSISRFASVLNAYDYERPFYIGGISEPKADLSGIGYFAYGGAGMIFSSGLVKELAPKVPECIEQASVEWGGDGRLAECVTRYSRTRLTYLRDLHQMDIVGDQSGIYESGFKPLTLHHWRGWANIPMPKVGQIAALTGGRGLFQRWRFSDGYVLTNGFSLVKYGSLARRSDTNSLSDVELRDEIDFTKTEFTWDNGVMSEFEHSLGPFRPRLTADQKITWLFVDGQAENSEDGLVRQFYVRKEGRQGLPEVVELAWSD